jgi:RNA polymerase sigma factor (sigma-70 family)
MSAELESPLAILTGRRDEFAEFARRRTRTDEDAEDVLQGAFLLATRKVEALRDPACAVPWFYRILRNAVADYHAGLAIKQARHDLAPVNEPTLVPPHESRTCACSLSLLDSLTTGYAEILRRVDVLEESVERVAEALGLSTNNATVRLHRARKALRRRLADFCGTTSAKECQSCRCATGTGPNPC